MTGTLLLTPLSSASLGDQAYVLPKDASSAADIEALEQRKTELAEQLTRQHTPDLAAHVERYCDFLT